MKKETNNNLFIVISVSIIVMSIFAIFAFLCISGMKSRDLSITHRQVLVEKVENELLGFLNRIEGDTKIRFYPAASMKFKWIQKEVDSDDLGTNEISGLGYGTSSRADKTELWEASIDNFFSSIEFVKNIHNSSEKNNSRILAYDNKSLACVATIKSPIEEGESTMLLSCGRIRRPGEEFTIKKILNDPALDVEIKVSGYVNYTELDGFGEFKLSDLEGSITLWDCGNYSNEEKERELTLSDLNNNDHIKVTGTLKNAGLNKRSTDFCVKSIEKLENK